MEQLELTDTLPVVGPELGGFGFFVVGFVVGFAVGPVETNE